MNTNSDQSKQCAPAVLLVRPAHFGFNPETAASNRLQRDVPSSQSELRARDEFENLCAALRVAGVRTCVVDDTEQPAKPDAVFPNNWVSFHRDGSIVLYPMQAPNRRLERRWEVVAAVETQLRFRRRRLIDLSSHERDGRFLEGTGSLVLDHVARIAYACRSARTDEALVHEWAKLMNYDAVVFDASGRDGTALYHTNVLLCIGTGWAVVCSQAIAPRDRALVLQQLGQRGRQLVDIGLDALYDFAGNMLELIGIDGGGLRRSVLLMSERAQAALQNSPAGIWAKLCSSVDQVLAIDVASIETVGGGSVRCMVAEVPECNP